MLWDYTLEVKKRCIKMNKNILIIILMMAVVILSVEGDITGFIIKEKEVVIHMPMSRDFRSNVSESLNFDITFPEENFRVGGKEVDKVIFIESEKVQGLIVGYSFKDRRIFGGIPMMYTENVTIFDGKSHQVRFSFNNEFQSIKLDNKLLAKSEFRGVK